MWNGYSTGLFGKEKQQARRLRLGVKKDKIASTASDFSLALLFFPIRGPASTAPAIWFPQAGCKSNIQNFKINWCADLRTR
jgi:hypothetical protein